MMIENFKHECLQGLKLIKKKLHAIALTQEYLSNKYLY
jgi:hypothetical protein